MKPVIEWTTEDLQVELTHPRNSGPNGADRRTAALAELLRRERERCADEIGSHMYCAFFGDTCSCVACAAAIRGLT